MTPSSTNGQLVEFSPIADVVVGGRYKLIEPVARGGMGEVWRAKHLELDSDVAIKLMALEYSKDSTLRERFRREAKAAAKLRSPHVVQILDFGIFEKKPYFVMELLQGEDLRTRLKRERRMTIGATADIMRHCAQALMLARKHKIVHRDLKPSNIFIERHDGKDVVKILDFGVAKSAAHVTDHTTTGMLLGSPHYMSPEQARGATDVDHRSDVWALGVIAFRMITGKRPFKGATMGDLAIKICIEKIPSATSQAADLPAEVDAFFELALARDPDERFSTAAEFSGALDVLARVAVPAMAESTLTGGSHNIAAPTSVPPLQESSPSHSAPSWSRVEPTGAVRVSDAPPAASASIPPGLAPDPLLDFDALDDHSVSLLGAVAPPPYKKWALAGGTLLFLLVAGVALTGEDELRPLKASVVSTERLQDAAVLAEAHETPPAEPSSTATVATKKPKTTPRSVPRVRPRPGPRATAIAPPPPRPPPPRPPRPNPTVDPVLGF